MFTSDQMQWLTGVMKVDPGAMRAPDGPGRAPVAGGDHAVPRPMLPDCAPLRNRIAGPANHFLCKTHGHVYDEKARTIIANSVEEYDAQRPLPRPMEHDCKPIKGNRRLVPPRG